MLWLRMEKTWGMVSLYGCLRIKGHESNQFQLSKNEEKNDWIIQIENSRLSFKSQIWKFFLH